MKKYRDNICKFVPDSFGHQLKTSDFVYEFDSENLNKRKNVKKNMLCIVSGGSGTLCTDYGKNELRSGSIFFCFENVPYRVEDLDNMEVMYITFSGSRCAELFSRFAISPVSPVFEGNEGLLSFWKNAIGKANEKNIDLLSESVLLYTFSHMSAFTEPGEKQVIGEVLRFVDENFTDATLSLEAVAKELGYSSKYISRAFKESVNITFSEYLRNSRIQHAISLMEHGIISVKNAALLSGYRDPLYFSNVFKKCVGISPGEYIKKRNINKHV
ncbi:MAG: helix-turn-helix transcriptional regulator [Clostridia bacterium]|nr:helix-turn-helix transcriptional regulator [Clostridia bacterium]